MATDQGNIKEKRQPKFANFGEYLFWSYANLFRITKDKL